MNRTIIFVVLPFLVSLPFAAQSAAQTADFERDVLPIFESRCVECHGPPKKDAKGRLRGPKGGLRLDGRGYIESGSDNSDRVVVPGNPERSLIHTLTSLPEGDLDIMPSKGKPLTADQIETLRVWIAEGASFGKWTGTGGPKKPMPRKPASASLPNGPPVRSLEILRTLGKDLEPLSATQLRGLCDGLASVEPVFPGSPLLRVSFTSHQREVQDDHVKDLRSIATHIAYLDLSRTAISNKGLQSLKTLPRLVRLDLHDTKIDDAGLKSLGAQPELRSLVLHQTPVSDACVSTLGTLSKLSDLYLWGTKITPSGLAQISEALPKAKVRGAPTFPEPAEEEQRGRRRRGK